MFSDHDWHIGHALHDRKSHVEFGTFLNRLAALIEDENIDVLIVAGNVFDNSSPSNYARELYYRFLCRGAAGKFECRNPEHREGTARNPVFLLYKDFSRSSP